MMELLLLHYYLYFISVNKNLQNLFNRIIVTRLKNLYNMCTKHIMKIRILSVLVLYNVFSSVVEFMNSTVKYIIIDSSEI